MCFQLDHLQCFSKDIAPIVLMPSNPAKADCMGSMLKGSKKIGQYREFTTWKGTYNSVPVSVVSTGVGCPSTAIAVEEVISAGAKILIRVGTCGGAWRRDIPCGSIVIPTACIREDGATQEYVPLMYPAVADYDVVRCLSQSAIDKGISPFIGINRTHDAYYGSGERRKMWEKSLRSSRVSLKRHPILSSEMECSVLFTIASLRGVRAGAILAVNADPEPIFLDADDTFTPKMKSNSSYATASEELSISLALQATTVLQKLIL